MPLTDNKITAFQKKVVDLTDVPSENMSPADLKAWFDSSPEQLRVKHNDLVDDLAANTGAVEIGAKDEAGLNTTVQAQLDKLSSEKSPIENVEAVELRMNDVEQGFSNVEVIANEANAKSNLATAQANNIIANAGDSNTEIVDARLRSDGTTAVNVGAHIREVATQFAEIVTDTIYTTDAKYGIKADGITDDTAGFQMVMNEAVANNQDIMLLGSILINGSIIINRAEADRKIINIKGQGELIKNNAGFMFTSTTTHRTGGNIRFSGIKFRSINGIGTVILDGAKLIRIYANTCDFLNVDAYFKVPSDSAFPNNYIQTLYLTDCAVVGGKGWFADAPIMYDFSFTHSILEHRESGFKCITFSSVRIFDSLIEGIDGELLYCLGGRSLDISNNYIEHCSMVNNKPYIEITGVYTTDSSISIKNNMFTGTDAQVADVNFYSIKFKALPSNTRVGGNSSSTHLYKVEDVYSITTEFIKSALLEKVDKNVINTMPRKEVIIGDNSLIRDVSMPFDTTKLSRSLEKVFTTDTDVTLFESGKNATMFATVSTSKAGVKLKRKANLTANVNYVIGLQGLARLENQPNTIIKVLDSVNAVVWSYVLDWEKRKGTRNIDDSYSLPPLKVSTTGDYSIQIELDSTNAIPYNSGFSLGCVVIQKGTIASFPTSHQLESNWDGEHLRMGSFSIWVDATGKARIKNGYPTSDIDGTIIGSQV